MKSTAFSMISEPRRLKNLGKSPSDFLLESSGGLSAFSSGLPSSSGLSSEKKLTNFKKISNVIPCNPKEKSASGVGSVEFLGIHLAQTP